MAPQEPQTYEHVEARNRLPKVCSMHTDYFELKLLEKRPVRENIVKRHASPHSLPLQARNKSA